MALKKSFTFRGLTAAEGYHRITRIGIDIDSKRVDVGVRSYANEAERKSNPNAPLQESSYSIMDTPARKHVVPKEDGTSSEVEVAPAKTGWTDFQANLAAGQNPQQAAYGWLKTAALSGSTDV